MAVRTGMFYTPSLPPSAYQYQYLYQQLARMAIVINNMEARLLVSQPVRAKDFYIASLNG